DHKDPNHNVAVRLARRWFPVTARFHGEHFAVRAGSRASHEREQPGGAAVSDEMVDRARPGALLLTPLALALAVIESTDLVFAVDSIPAVFAITADPFLVFTSNVFAILGLRSLYFALAGMMDKFRYLKVSLALVLMIVGGKMLVAKWLEAAVGGSFNFYLLAMVFLILAAGVMASLVTDRRRRLRPAIDAGRL
ncbi:MAG: TerC family protein, partial [Solirubrobacterales bacterium]